MKKIIIILLAFFMMFTFQNTVFATGSNNEQETVEDINNDDIDTASLGEDAMKARGIEPNHTSRNMWWIWLIIFAVIVGIMLAFSHKNSLLVLQTTKGTITQKSKKLSRQQVETLIEKSEKEPSAQVYNNIIKEIDKR